MNDRPEDSAPPVQDGSPSPAPAGSAASDGARSAWKLHVIALAAVITAAVPFVLTVRLSSTSSVNGKVTSSSIDPVAILGGAAALVLAIVVIAFLVRGRARGPGNTVAAVVAILAGGFHLANGFGAFAKPDSRAATLDMPSLSPPLASDDDWRCTSAHPERCALACTASGDADACNQASLSAFNAGDHAQAYTLAKKGCELGGADACGNLGALTLEGKGVTADRAGALKHFRRACDLGNTGRCLGLVGYITPEDHLAPDDIKALLDKGCGQRPEDCGKAGDLALKNGRLAGARLLYGRSCEAGNADNCNETGRLHFRTGPDYSQSEGRRYYALACEKGSWAGCINHGEQKLLEDPADVAAGRAALTTACAQHAADCDKFAREQKTSLFQRELFLAACQAGNVASCNDAGLAYVGENALEVDRTRALALFERACEGGDFYGCRNAGAAQLGEFGGEVQLEAAWDRFAKACRAKGVSEPCSRVAHAADKHGQRALALRLLRLGCDELRQGESCALTPFYLREDDAPDLASLPAASEEACKLDSAVGCRNLGVLYRDGQASVTVDIPKALSLFDKGCQLGGDDSCVELALIYAEGRHQLPRDEAKAATYYARACELGSEESCAKAPKPAAPAPATP